MIMIIVIIVIIRVLLVILTLVLTFQYYKFPYINSRHYILILHIYIVEVFFKSGNS